MRPISLCAPGMGEAVIGVAHASRLSAVALSPSSSWRYSCASRAISLIESAYDPLNGPISWALFGTTR